jgi:GNAT superfamily N-acetyltransferase
MVDWKWVRPGETEALEQIRALFVEYQAELGVDLCFQSFQEELDSLPGAYSAPTGALLAGEASGQIVACGALRSIADGTCELKRIYVRPGFRGLRLGEKICIELMKCGRELGYRNVRLDTLRRLVPAGRMYEKLGFAEIEPYNFNPEPDIVYLERGLDADLRLDPEPDDRPHEGRAGGG